MIFPCCPFLEGVDMEDGFLRGHGTQVVDDGGRLVATVCGTVERVNKLVSVRPLRSRYVPETGDVVLGRVTEIAGKRWKLDVNSRQDAVLQLSAVNLPGGIQRRRNAVDELNMRQLYGENDLVSAEVQSFYADGAVALHTRSLKYGRLSGGQLVRVMPTLIKRVKQHFHRLSGDELGGGGDNTNTDKHKEGGGDDGGDVEVLLGCNGFVWIGTPSVATSAAGDNNDYEAARTKERTVGPEARERICRVANAIRVLAALFLAIHPPAILDVYRCSVEWGVSPKDMLGTGFLVRTLERESERRIARGGV